MLERDHRPSAVLSRRRFATWVLAGGATALLPDVSRAEVRRAPLPPVPHSPDERFWEAVRAQFLVPRELAPLNAANLCPSPRPVVDALVEQTHRVDRDPSPHNRAALGEEKERTRRILAQYLRATPEEIVITRNTSEANNMVSSGLALGPGDEVLVLADNHPSNHAAWRAKGARFGFTVSIVEQPNPHPGPDFYVNAFRRRMTPRTRLLGLTHVTNTAGDALPVRELCALARERGVLTLVDGAQAFGVLDVDLSDLQPDFYTGSAHKWPCGAREAGVLYARRDVHDRLHPTVVSLYAGAVGLARDLEGFGQRDEAAIVAFGTALEFQLTIGVARIEARARELTAALVEGLRAIPSVTLRTSPDPVRSAAVVSFRPGGLDARRLADRLYHEYGVICAVQGGGERGFIRFSPHFYNLREEIERAVGAVRSYVGQEG